jgi:photosystem II stability/assembly factor-like uncharacterized protein
MRSGDSRWRVQHGGTHEWIRSFFETDERSFIVGSQGLLLVSTDGETWTKQALPAEGWLGDVWGDGQTLFIVGEEGLVLASTDGGTSWKKRTRIDDEFLVGIWGAGGDLHVGASRGTIARSSDGGKTWKTQPSGMNPMNGVWGLAADNVFAVGSELVRSTDRGETWKPAEIPGRPDKSHFADICGHGSDVYAVGLDGLVVASHDAGQSWTVLPPPTKDHLAAVLVTASGQLIVASSSGAVLQSDDQGQTWVDQPYESTLSLTGSRPRLDALAINSKGVVYAMGFDMSLLARKPGGLWVEQRSKSKNHMHAVWGEASGKRVYAAGWGGTLLCTEDRGLNWTRIKTGAKTSQTAILRGIWGTRDGAHLFVVGDEVIAQSSNHGAEWSCTKSRHGLCSVWGDVGTSGAPRRVFAVSHYGALVSSLDGGRTWQESSLASHLEGLKRKSSGTLRGIWGQPDGPLFIVGSPGLILRSTDDGKTWASIPSGTKEGLHAMTGVGNELFIVGYRGVILRSTDGGETWASDKVKTPQLHAVAGTPSGAVLVVGDKGVIFRLEPGGSWKKQKTDNDQHLHGVWCSDSGDCYAGGDN